MQQREKSKHTVRIAKIYQEKISIYALFPVSNECCINSSTTFETAMFLSAVTSWGFTHIEVLCLWLAHGVYLTRHWLGF